LANNPPPIVTPPTSQDKSNRVAGIIIIVIGGAILLFGLLQVVTADSPYEAGRAMGRVTLGGLGTAGGIYLVRKSKS
jgi:hypothetical protein